MKRTIYSCSKSFKYANRIYLQLFDRGERESETHTPSVLLQYIFELVIMKYVDKFQFTVDFILQVYNTALEVNNLLQTSDVAKYLARKHVQESENKCKLTGEEAKLLEMLRRQFSELFPDAEFLYNHSI